MVLGSSSYFLYVRFTSCDAEHRSCCAQLSYEREEARMVVTCQASVKRILIYKKILAVKQKSLEKPGFKFTLKLDY
jgi:hypothetical protein